MPTIKEYSQIEAGLAELRKKYLVVYDVSTKEGYLQCKKSAKEVGKYRIDLESKRKEIKEPALQRCKDIDGEAKRIQLEIYKIEDPLKISYKAVDDKIKKEKEEMIARIESKIEDIRGYSQKSLNSSPSEISKYIEIVDSVDCTQGFYNLTKEALIARNETLDYLSDALKQAIQKEIDEKVRISQEKELVELRKIKADQEKRDREIAEKEAELAHKVEIQEQAIKAEEDKKQALKQSKIDADNAEIKRLADIKKAEEEATQREIDRQSKIKTDADEAQRKLEANKKHAGGIRRAAKLDLIEITGVDEKLAVRIVMAISKKLISNVSINY